MWCRTQRSIAAVAVGLACACSAALGQEGPGVFYQGPLVVRKVSGTIDLKTNDPPVAPLEVSVAKLSKLEGPISLAFHDSEGASLTPSVNAMQTVTLAPKPEWTSDASGLRQVRLDLVLEIDGAPLNEPIDEVDVLIQLPPGVPALIRSSMPLQPANAPLPAYKRPTPGHPARHLRAPPPKREQPGTLPEPVTVGDRVAYRLVLRRSYLTELNLVYNVSSVTLDIKKGISTTSITAGSVVKFTLRMCNRGPDAANQVVVSDNFDPRDFDPSSGTGALGSFDYWIGSPNDRRLLWTYTAANVPLCTSGQLTVPFYLKANYEVSHCVLNRTTATIAGKLVGTSNKIQIP